MTHTCRCSIQHDVTTTGHVISHDAEVHSIENQGTNYVFQFTFVTENPHTHYYLSKIFKWHISHIGHPRADNAQITYSMQASRDNAGRDN